jgi:hypothetical protein
VSGGILIIGEICISILSNFAIMNKWRVLGMICCLVWPFTLLAQSPDYTGVWQGKFYDNSSFVINNDPYKFEVQIEQNGKSLLGVTYSYLNTSFYGKASHNGFIKTDAKKLVFIETRLLELRSQSGLACLMTCNMRYYKQGNEEFLEGTYTAVDKDNGTPCPGGYVKLKKVVRSDFRMEPNVKKKLDDIKKQQTLKGKPKPPIVKNNPPVKPLVKNKPPVVKNNPPVKPPVKNNPPIVKNNPPVKPPVKKDTPVKVVIIPPPVKKDTPVIAPPVVIIPPVLNERSNELVQEVILTDTNEVVVNLYDYGEVDGDIVTIFLDNREIISKQMLRVIPISVPIKVDAIHPEHTLTLVAENLGSIPPNTALMVVYVNGQRYEVKIESTEQKNATVKFIYKPGKK